MEKFFKKKLLNTAIFFAFDELNTPKDKDDDRSV